MKKRLKIRKNSGKIKIGTGNLFEFPDLLGGQEGLAMKLAVCGASSSEKEQLCGWIMQYCRLYRLPVDIVCVDSREKLKAYPPGTFQIVFTAFGGAGGFLTARALREQDRNCRIVLVDDDARFAVQGVQMHFSNLLVRPIRFPAVAESMRLALAPLPGRYLGERV